MNPSGKASSPSPFGPSLALGKYSIASYIVIPLNVIPVLGSNREVS
jgi:hypothetical protein